jgi:peptidoglycan/xylan/chitin deacetylase (PgdA/CDA1 family)
VAAFAFTFSALGGACGTSNTNAGPDAGPGVGPTGGQSSDAGSTGSTGSQSPDAGPTGSQSADAASGEDSATPAGDGGAAGVSYDPKSCTWIGGAAPATGPSPANTTALTGDGCAGGACLNPTCAALGTPAPLGSFPGIGFDMTYDGPNFSTPTYIPNDVIIPTLDDVTDGPDPVSSPPDGYSNGEWTKTILQFLDANNMHWDFFMNTNNWDGPITGDPTKDDPDGYNNFVDILAKHYPANHTVHHIHMGYNVAPDPMSGIPQGCDGALTTVTCDAELSGVETVIDTISAKGRPHMTRFRPPYGEPYQFNMPGNLADVEPVVAKYAVWVGWNFLTNDATNDPCSCVDEGAGQACSTDTQGYNCTSGAYTQFTTAIGTGPGKGTAWGVVLMHGVLPWTASVLPKLFGPGGYVAKAGFRVGTVEDAICWKYGMHSWDIVNKVNKYTGADARGPN